MKIPAELTAIIEKIINDEVERRIKSYPIYVRIDGQLIDHSETFEGGQIDINIETPIFFPKNGMEFVLTTVPKEVVK